MICIELFLAFAQIAMFSIGGGYAAMPLIRSQVVDTHGWMTMSEFIDLITIAEMTPGPIQLNAATFAGTRVAGLSGAVCATMGVVAPSLILVSLLAWAYAKYRELRTIKAVLGALRPAVVALIASAGLSVLLTVLFGGKGIAAANFDACGAALYVLALLVLRKKKLSPVLTMLLCGAGGVALGIIFGP